MSSSDLISICQCQPPVRSLTLTERRLYWEYIVQKSNLKVDMFERYYCQGVLRKTWYKTDLCYIITNDAWKTILSSLSPSNNMFQLNLSTLDLRVQEMSEINDDGYNVVEVTSMDLQQQYLQAQASTQGVIKSMVDILETSFEINKNELDTFLGGLSDMDSAVLPSSSAQEKIFSNEESETDTLQLSRPMPPGQSYLDVTQQNIFTSLENIEKFCSNALAYSYFQSFIGQQASTSTLETDFKKIIDKTTVGQRQRYFFNMLFSGTDTALCAHWQSPYFNVKYDIKKIPQNIRNTYRNAWQNTIIVGWMCKEESLKTECQLIVQDQIVANWTSLPIQGMNAVDVLQISQSPLFCVDDPEDIDCTSSLCLNPSYIHFTPENELCKVGPARRQDGPFQYSDNETKRTASNCMQSCNTQSGLLKLNPEYWLDSNDPLAPGSSEIVRFTRFIHLLALKNKATDKYISISQTSLVSLENVESEYTSVNQELFSHEMTYSYSNEKDITMLTAVPDVDDHVIFNNRITSGVLQSALGCEQESRCEFEKVQDVQYFCLLYNRACFSQMIPETDIDDIPKINKFMLDTNTNINTNFILMRADPTEYGLRVNPVLQPYARNKNIIWMMPLPEIEVDATPGTTTAKTYQGYSTCLAPPPLLHNILYKGNDVTTPRLALKIANTNSTKAVAREDVLFSMSEIHSMRLLKTYTNPNTGEMQGALIIDPITVSLDA